MIEILFENQNLIAVMKPAGLLSVPSRDRADARGIVGLQVQEKLKMQVFPIHRLDFEVSGILLFAKNAHTHKKWQDLFQSHQVQKIYQAITVMPEQNNIPEKFQGIFQQPKLDGESKWECRLEKGKRRVFEADYGKKSVTLAKVLKSLNAAEVTEIAPKFGCSSLDGPSDDKSKFLLWELQPITGRSHQLRYELFRHGCPIVGDVTYGSQFKIGKAIMLAHTEFSLTREVDGVKLLQLEKFRL